MNVHPVWPTTNTPDLELYTVYYQFHLVRDSKFDRRWTCDLFWSIICQQLDWKLCIISGMRFKRQVPIKDDTQVASCGCDVSHCHSLQADTPKGQWHKVTVKTRKLQSEAAGGCWKRPDEVKQQCRYSCECRTIYNGATGNGKTSKTKSVLDRGCASQSFPHNDAGR